jgi:hypothetical protein
MPLAMAFPLFKSKNSNKNWALGGHWMPLQAPAGCPDPGLETPHQNIIQIPDPCITVKDPTTYYYQAYLTVGF